MRYSVIAWLSLLVWIPGQAANLTINLAQKYQTIEGFGGGSVYYTNWLTAHPNRQAIYDTMFTGLGLSYLRIGNWNQDTTATLVNDSTIVAEGKKRLGGRLRLLMSSWSAPGFLKVSGQSSGTKNGAQLPPSQNTLLKKNGVYVYADFAHWWKQTVLKYRAKGMGPDDISLQNEPDMNASYEGTIFAPTQSDTLAGYDQAFRAVADSVHGIPSAPRVLGPEVLGIGWNNVTKFTSKMDLSKTDAVNYHLYHAGSYSNPDGYNSDIALIATAVPGKPIIMTEYCNMDGAFSYNMINGVRIIQNLLVKGNVSGYINWELFWGGGGQMVNVENPWTASAWTSTNGYIVNPEYHGMRHFSKFTSRGWKRVGTVSSDSLVRSVAFLSAIEDSLTVVTLNLTATDQTLNLNPANYTLRARWFSQTSGNMSQKMSLTAGQVSYSLGDSSITTFVYTKNSSSSSSSVMASSSSVFASSSSAKVSSSSVAMPSSSSQGPTQIQPVFKDHSSEQSRNIFDLLGRLFE
jgi:O-glycosyl hydrolase